MLEDNGSCLLLNFDLEDVEHHPLVPLSDGRAVLLDAATAQVKFAGLLFSFEIWTL
jgi:hypothetical protein